MANQTKTEIPFYQIDAFTTEAFGGNPAGVCRLTEWLDDDILQAIAIENNLSETAFYLPWKEGYHLRWFTPGCEVDLCGHATLATAHVLFQNECVADDAIKFYTRSGILTVTRAGDELCMDFPAICDLAPCHIDAGILQALGIDASAVVQTWKSFDYVIMVNDPDVIEKLNPDFARLSHYATRGFVVTSQHPDYDFVSRWFGPNVGVNEDPVTGSAHTILAPLWANYLGKNPLTARQGGARKGELRCVMREDSRVELYGSARTVITGVFCL